MMTALIGGLPAGAPVAFEAASHYHNGQLRHIVSQIGDALAEWLEEQMNDRGTET